jgi:hypothetical protein
VTTLDPVADRDGPSHFALRLTALLVAVLLSLQCIWLSAAQLIRPKVDQLPTDAASAAAAAKQRDAAFLAASIGAIRGDLWANAAFTNADLLWSEKGASEKPDSSKTLPRARLSIDRALDEAPHQSGVWLLVAGLARRFPSLGLNATEPLKMSYYTGPSELRLVPLRLRIAVQSDSFSDIEMRQFLSRDIRLLLAQKQTPAISNAYNVASSAGRSFIEQTVKDIDPSALDTLRTGAQKQSLPD